MSQSELNKVKRLLCQRLLNDMPEEALGELLVEMREIAHFYKTDDLLNAQHDAGAAPAPVAAQAG